MATGQEWITALSQHQANLDSELAFYRSQPYNMHETVAFFERERNAAQIGIDLFSEYQLFPEKPHAGQVQQLAAVLAYKYPGCILSQYVLADNPSGLVSWIEETTSGIDSH